MVDVCVIGAGVIGLTAAVVIQERLPNVRVTVVADTFDRYTHSYGSGGLVAPSASVLPDAVSHQCCRDSFEYFCDLGFSSQSRDSGVSVVNAFIMTNGDKAPEMTNFMYNVHQMEPKLLQRFGSKEKYKNGYIVTTTVVNLPVYLKWLMKRFESKGGRIVQRSISSFYELGDQYQVVVNCTGVGSEALASDPSVQPAKGQTVHVEAPWVKTLIHSDDYLCVFPFSNSVLLGTIKQKGNKDTSISKVEGRRIFDRAADIFPPLQGAKVMWDWVGMRPVRDVVRIEREILHSSARAFTVVHNYGHGSFGVSLSWGCAVQVSKLVQESLQQITSKL